MTHSTSTAVPAPPRKPHCFKMAWGFALVAVATVTAYLLWRTHRSHVIAVLPYLLLLLCPLLHILMHRRHGGRHSPQARGVPPRGSEEGQGRRLP